MKTLAQLFEAVMLTKTSAEEFTTKTARAVKNLHTPKNRGQAYNPVPKLLKFAHGVGFKNVQRSERVEKDDQGNITSRYPIIHMAHPEHAGHHLIIGRKGFIYRSPSGKIKTGQNKGNLKRHFKTLEAFYDNKRVHE